MASAWTDASESSSEDTRRVNLHKRGERTILTYVIALTLQSSVLYLSGAHCMMVHPHISHEGASNKQRENIQTHRITVYRFIQGSLLLIHACTQI